MARNKCCITIGQRAMLEVFRLFPNQTNRQIATVIGCGKCVVGEWGHGVAPSAKYLERLHELGADVIWILTGEKKGKT